MLWYQRRQPNLTRKVQPGWCLGYVSDVLGINSAKYESAWQAWQGTEYKHGPEEPLPDVPVLLWFEHFGTYGTPPRFGNWGHVVLHVPGVGLYTSPGGAIGSPASFEVHPTISAIEHRFNSTYVGWSEDLAGVRFAEPVPIQIIHFLEAQMANPIINVTPRNALMIGTNDGKFVEYATPKAMNSRGIISHAFYGAPGGDKDTIPSMNEGDFKVVQTVWRQMCTGARW